MLTSAEYLAALHRKGIKLWVENGQLRYRAGKGSLSAEELLRLRELKAGIIAQLLSAERNPLSFQQQFLLSTLQRHPGWAGSLAYAFRLAGTLHSELLEQSLASLLQRHEALRSRIVVADGVPTQQIDEPCEIHLDIVPVSGDTDSEVHATTRLHAGELITQQSRLAASPLLSMRLLRVSTGDHVLVLVIHRLIADCLSIGQVLRELWQSYGELLQGKPISLSAPSTHYRDYARWQQTHAADWEQKHAAYWDERLAGAPGIRWPMSKPSDDGHSATLGSLTLAFGERLSADLRNLGRQGKTLPGMVLLAIYVAAVSSWCHQRDFVVPFNLIGRHSEHENVVGCFSHVLYLRVTLTGNETFMELLKLTAQAFYRATFHQDYGRMALQRPELLEATLFQWLSWHPHEVPGLTADEMAGHLQCAVENMQAQDTAALTALPSSAVAVEMSFFEAPDGICALAHFRADVFTLDEMNRFMNQLRALSEHIVRDPSMRSVDA